VVVVAAGREERGLRAVALGDLETEHTDIKIEGTLEVGDLQVDVADAGTGGDGRIFLGHVTETSRVGEIRKVSTITPGNLCR
jgi:hypothetical protein